MLSGSLRKDLSPLLTVVFAFGCGASVDPDPSGSGGGSGGAGGAGGAGASGGGPVAGGSSGTGGAPVALDCSGEFGGSQAVLTLDSGRNVSSPAIGPDELELFYFEHPSPAGLGESHFMRSTRATTLEPFDAGVPLPELDTACEQPNYRGSIDLSRDGLRAYVACYEDGRADVAGTLRVARRAALGDAFVLDAMSYGTVGASATVAPNELELFSSSRVGFPGEGPPEDFQRASVDDPFGTGTPVPGLESTGITTPDLDGLGLTLFGAEEYSIVASTRPDQNAPFSSPVTVLAGDASWNPLGAPELSADCRSLYYVQVDVFADAVPPSTWSIRKMTR